MAEESRVKERIAAELKKFDANQDGYIRKEDLLKALLGLDGLTEAEVDAIISAWQATEGGDKIAYNEFLGWLFKEKGEKKKEAKKETDGSKKEEEAQLEKLRAGLPDEVVEAEEQDLSNTGFNIEEWLQSIKCMTYMANVLKAAAQPKKIASEVQFVRALAKHGSKDLVFHLLQEGRVLERFAEIVWAEARKLNEVEDDEAEKLSHQKFLQDYGQLQTYFGSLEELIGPPSSNLMKAMEREHNESEDSDHEWVTRGYDVATTPQIEWAFVVNNNPDQKPNFTVKIKDGAETKLRTKWPTEQALEFSDEPEDKQKMRKPKSLDEMEKKMDIINNKLAKLKEEKLTMAEVVGVRLYTGPMNEKYNAANRGGSLSFEQPAFLKRRFNELCKDNRYVTTVHVINSCILKLSRIAHATKVYRGLGGTVLHKDFWKKNPFGVCGGVELGFFSATEDMEVAKHYEGTSCTVFEIDMGQMDRGADISMFSQYLHEKEICFTSITGLEVTRTRVDGQLLIVEARVDVNAGCLTIEQVLGKRKKVLVDMCENLKVETLRMCPKDTPLELALLEDHGLDGLKSLPHWIEARFNNILQVDAAVFNDDDTFRQSIDRALNVKRFACLGEKTLTGIGERGSDAARCTQMVGMKLWDDDRKVRLAAFDTACKIREGLEEKEEHLFLEIITVAMQDRWKTIHGRAFETLLQIAGKGNRQAIQAVICRLEDTPEICECAFKALGKVAKTGDPEAVEALLACLEDKTRDVRELALNAMVEVVENGHQEVIKAVVAHLKDEPAVIRSTAIRTLRGITDKGHEKAIKAIKQPIEIFDDPNITPTWDDVSLVRQEAAKALGVIGNEGDQEIITILVRSLKDNDSGVRLNVLESLRQLTVKGDEQVIAAVLERLEEENLLNVRVVVAELLVTVDDDEQSYQRAVQVLAYCSKERAVDSNWHVRREAARVLGKIGRKGDKQIIVTLIASAKDVKEEVRDVAALAIGQIGYHGDEHDLARVIARLLELRPVCEHSSPAPAPAPSERAGSKRAGSKRPDSGCLVMAGFRAGSKKALDARAAAAAASELAIMDSSGGAAPSKDEPRCERCVAVEALEQLAKEGDAGSIVYLLIDRLQEDTNADVRRDAAQALGRVGPQGDEDVIAMLTTRLKDEDWNVRQNAAWALGHVGNKGDEQIISTLIGRLKDADKHVRAAVVGALWRLAERGDRQIVSALLDRLKDRDDDVRRDIVRTLGQVGNKGDRQIITMLIARLKDTNEQVQQDAAQILGWIGYDGDEHEVARLIPLLKDQEFTNRVAAVQELGVLGRRDEGSIVLLLVDRFQDLEWRVRLQACETLSEIAQKGDQDIKAAVITRLKDEEGRVRKTACDTLSKVAYKGDKDSIGALIASAKDERPHVRGAAVEALGWLANKGDKRIIAALIEHLKDQEYSGQIDEDGKKMHVCDIAKQVMNRIRP